MPGAGLHFPLAMGPPCPQSGTQMVPHVSAAAAAILTGLGLFAGWLGAVIGIGGGVVIVPVLVLAFGYDIHIAVATSLVAVVATSTAAGSIYVGEGLANMRLGMVLEIATTVGGIAGGLLAIAVSPSLLSGLFAVMMLVTAALMVRAKDSPRGSTPKHASAPATKEATQGYEVPGELAGAYYDHHRSAMVHYRVGRLGVGIAISMLAGTLSGMLGVGGGFLKVPAMTLGMHVPIKVATATSNFMIGVTAITSLFLYFAHGYLHPFIAAPIALGVSLGAPLGTRTAARVSPGALRRLIAVVMLFIAAQMALAAWGIRLGG